MRAEAGESANGLTIPSSWRNLLQTGWRLTWFSLTIRQIHFFKIFIPFNREEVFLLVITSFACGRNIPSGASPAPGDWDDVIHRQFRRLEPFAAVMADALASPTLPPLTLPKKPRFVFFFPECFGIYFCICKRIFHVSQLEVTIQDMKSYFRRQAIAFIHLVRDGLQGANLLTHFCELRRIIF